MVFRLPTPFDALVPAHSSSRRGGRPRPWRGTFILHGINLFQSLDGQQRLFVASAETEGDKSSRTDLWPKQFNLHVAQPSCHLSEVQAWVTRNDIPLCMFMPDRHAVGGIGSPGSLPNETHFRDLSRVMSDNQLVCMAPWPVPGYPEIRTGAGILILPNAASTGLLIGAVFLSTPFPDFMGLPSGGAGSSASAIPSGLPSSSDPFTGQELSFSNSFAPLPGSDAFGSGPGQGQEQGQGQGQNQGLEQYQLRQDAPAHLGHPIVTTTSSNAGAMATYSKPQPDNFSGYSSLRAALAAAPFDWAIFEDTDGSGSTSPGSTRTW